MNVGPGRLAAPFLALTSLTPLMLTGCDVRAAARRPDVVVILLDTTRADQLGPFADPDPTPTPFLNRLAEGSVVFENAWTASTHTAPSTASVFTGLVPLRHGVEENFLARAQSGPTEGQSLQDFVQSVELIGLPNSIATLSEHFQRGGYQTLGIGANINFSSSLGFSRGFDLFSEHPERDAEAMAAELAELWPQLDPNAPRFVYMHFMDAHTPYNLRKPWCPHEKRAECQLICRYRSEISYLDQQLESMFERNGWLEDTIVVLVTDHGEEFMEHGQIMHRYSVHGELSRAGLMIRVPGVEPRRTKIPAHHTDILPTLLDVVGLPRPTPTDGVELLRRLDSDESWERPLLTTRARNEKNERLYALTWKNWRLILSTPDGGTQLYDVLRDPGEREDLAEQRPKLRAKMLGMLDELRATLVPVPQDAVAVELSSAATEALIRLGYVGGEE